MGDLDQNPITDPVPPAVVNTLEGVKIHHQEDDWIIDPPGSSQFLISKDPKVAQVGQARQGIRIGVFLCLFVDDGIVDSSCSLPGQSVKQAQVVVLKDRFHLGVNRDDADDPIVQTQGNGDATAERFPEPWMVCEVGSRGHVGEHLIIGCHPARHSIPDGDPQLIQVFRQLAGGVVGQQQAGVRVSQEDGTPVIGNQVADFGRYQGECLRDIESFSHAF